MADADVSSVTGGYEHGLELARAGAYFEAHEAFEQAWRACRPDERDFFQGLVHVVVSAYQSGRGRPVAARTPTAEGAPPARRRSHRYTAGWTSSYCVAKLERAEADPREHLVERDPQPPVAVEEEQQPEHDQRPA